MNLRASLLLLYAATFLVWTVGNGLAPLVPLHAKSLGLSPVEIGLLQVGLYAALIAGTIGGGSLVAHARSPRRLMQVSALAGASAFLFLSLVRGIAGVAVGYMGVWLFLGSALCVSGLVAGAVTNAPLRTRALTVLAATSGAGALVGGVFMGGVLDRFGFGPLCLGLAALCVVASTLFGRVRLVNAKTPAPGSLPGGLGSWFALPLVMDAAGSPARYVSWATAAGAALALAVFSALGLLTSDRARWRVLALCAFGPAAGLSVLIAADAWGGFALASAGTSLFNYVGAGLAAAFLVATAPPERRNGRLVAFTTTGWLGGLVGYGLTGLSLDVAGPQATLIGGVVVGAVGAAALSIALLRLAQENQAGRSEPPQAVPELGARNPAV